VRRAGVKQVCIVTNHLEYKISEFVGDGSKWNLNVTYAHQNELRGTGDALLSVPHQWIKDESVLVVATDYILEEHALLDVVEAHKQSGAEITMSLKECPVRELMTRSTVEVDADWRVKRIIEKPTPDEILSPYAASVIYILPDVVWDYLPRIKPSVRGEIELPNAIQMMIEDGYKAFGLLQPAPNEWQPDFINKPLVE
jgi:dTDP-glucose pyrophosphorylase